MADSKRPEVNRRSSRRLLPKGKIKLGLYKGSMDLGANLAVSIVDISETGLRLLAKTALDQDQEVMVTLEGVAHRRSLKRTGKVIWSVPAENSAFLVGVRLHKPLEYRDVVQLT